jgi:hypothetical protein
MSNRPKKRILDKRYKAGVDSGTMSHLSIPLPLKSYSEITKKPEPVFKKHLTARQLKRKNKRLRDEQAKLQGKS